MRTALIHIAVVTKEFAGITLPPDLDVWPKRASGIPPDRYPKVRLLGR